MANITAHDLGNVDVKELLRLFADAVDVSDFLKTSSLLLKRADLPHSSPDLEARLLFQAALGTNHVWLIAHNDHVVSKKEQVQFCELLMQRLAGKPIAFILGTQAFWTLNLKVSPCTLIPRQDTEVLVETALALDLPANSSVLDLGTGTGAIALALAKEMPSWQVSGVDKIAQAVDLARENARDNHLQVSFEQSDWFSNVAGKYDLIVTNPPYVEPESEYLKKGDLRFEPLSALVADDNGLADIKMIIEAARMYLNKGAHLLIEHGFGQSEAVQALLCDAGFGDVKSMKDYNNLPRVSLGRL